MGHVVHIPTRKKGSAVVLVGMLGVAAMAMQNGLVRLALPGSASTALLTTNTMQLAADMATLIRGRGGYEELARARNRAGTTFPCIASFVAAGCAAGAFLGSNFHLSALVRPVILAVLAVPLGEVWSSQAMRALKHKTENERFHSEQARRNKKHEYEYY